MLNIAIDGPSGAGKSTVAKFLAKKLGILYLDTGAMYRGTAYFVRRYGADPADVAAVEKLLPELKMNIVYDEEVQRIFVCGEDVTPFIREHNISMDASTVSKIPAVRMKMVELQREIAKNSDCVLDGRDIGSYVLPNADFKFFLTATAEERARRRYTELAARGMNLTYEAVLNDIEARDYQDTHRDFAPLVCTDDAVKVDSTEMTIDEVIAFISKKVCAR